MDYQPEHDHAGEAASIAAEQEAYEARVAVIAEKYPAGEFCCRCLSVEPSEPPNVAVHSGLCLDCIDCMKNEYEESARQNTLLLNQNHALSRSLAGLPQTDKTRTIKLTYNPDGSVDITSPGDLTFREIEEAGRMVDRQWSLMLRKKDALAEGAA